MDSETRDTVDTDGTLIAKILNENQRCHHGKVLTLAKYSSNSENF